MTRRLHVVVLLLAGLASLPGAAQSPPQSSTTSYRYDANGNRTQVTDPLGHVTTLNYDALNRLQQQVQPAPQAGGTTPTVGYGYDGRDQLNRVTDPRALVTSYTTDGLGNPTGQVSPDTGTTSQTFDEAGNLKTSTDARGKITRYTYDALNRVTRIDYASGTPSTFEYDGGSAGAPNAIGHLTRMTDESGQTTYAYDGRGRLTTKTQTVGSGAAARSFTVRYSWGTSGSATGHLIALTYPSGFVSVPDYDAGGRVANLGVIDVDSTTVSRELFGITYSGAGEPIYWDFEFQDVEGNPQFSRSYDLDGNLTDTVFGSYVYRGAEYRTITHDAAGRVTGFSDRRYRTFSSGPTITTQSFAYDNLDRLTQAITGTVAQTYQYDASGNRTQVNFGSGNAAVVIDPANNRLQSAAAPSPLKNYSYDAAGHLLSDGRITFGYSDRGRMQSATVGGVTTGYRYNALGQRTWKMGASGNTYYVYDEQNHLLGEYGSDGKPQQETVFLGDIPVLVATQYLYLGQPRNLVYYVYTDHLNTPRVIADASENIVWRWANADPFGMQQPGGNDTRTPFTYNPRFPGQVFDAETGLHYNLFRDYDPQQGRYVQSDPIGLRGGPNTYTYARGNPISRIDPSGLLDGWTDPSGPPDMLPRPPIQIVRGIPSNACTCSSGGKNFPAPPGTNYNDTSRAGQNGGFNPFSANSAVGHFGAYDFQRDFMSNTFTGAYTDASNFSVGVYMQGAGFSRDETVAVGSAFARTMSKNAGAEAQAAYWKAGWDAANSGNLSEVCK